MGAEDSELSDLSEGRTAGQTVAGGGGTRCIIASSLHRGQDLHISGKSDNFADETHTPMPALPEGSVPPSKSGLTGFDSV